jgi:hypothetical protein
MRPFCLRWPARHWFYNQAMRATSLLTSAVSVFFSCAGVGLAQPPAAADGGMPAYQVAPASGERSQ